MAGRGARQGAGLPCRWLDPLTVVFSGFSDASLELCVMPKDEDILQLVSKAHLLSALSWLLNPVRVSTSSSGGGGNLFVLDRTRRVRRPHLLGAYMEDDIIRADDRARVGGARRSSEAIEPTLLAAIT